MSPDDTSPSSRSPGTACPNCGKPTKAAHRPFCSARCRNIDLGRWLKGGYRIETEEPAEDDSGEPS
ncbi:MAG TPA: DNA gyrase inhibitor YacG [Stellaceae bacterium]|nr:DNA gyrase inhibitor YacG [Stellaceae bacterium]